MPNKTPSFWDLFAKDLPHPPADPSFWDLFTKTGDDPGATSYEEFPNASSAISFDERKMFWAMRDLPIGEATQHLLAVGSTGSGKSTLIQLFLQSIAPRFQKKTGPPQHLIVFDGKCDAISQLASLGFYPEDENYYILNPHDQRCAVWDLAEGTKPPLMAGQLAALLVPDEPRSSAPFFWESARSILYAVILALNRSEVHWTFRDLICATDSKERIEAVAARHPRAKTIVKRIFDDERHGFGVLSSLAAKMMKFEQVAALWHSAKNAKIFTVEKFLSQPGILVLGDDPHLHETLWPVNVLLLRALTKDILHQPNTREPRHFFVLDEFPAMEQADAVPALLRRGRSKGVCVLLGTQSLEALYQIYGEAGAEDILSQCHYKTFLHVGGPKTAAWIESYFGQVRQKECSYSESWGKGGTSYSISVQLQDRSLFLASTFLNLPLPAPGGLFICVSDVPCLNSCFITRRWFDDILSWLKPMSTVPASLPRLSIEEQTLQEWTAEEEKVFTASGKAKKSKSPKSTEEKPYLPKADRRRSSEFRDDF